MKASLYLKYLIGCAGLILISGAAFNYVIDPAGIYHYGKTWDWIKSRSNLTEMLYIHKAHAVVDARADILFLGSSRVLEGFDPDNAALPGKAYNLALDGGRVYEGWRYLQHAANFHLPKIVLLGVDPQIFGGEHITNPDLEGRLSLQPDGKPTPYYQWADLSPTLLSFSTLTASIDTLRNPEGVSICYRKGYEANAELLLHLNLTSNVLDATKEWIDRRPFTNFRNVDGTAPQLDAYEQIITFCAEHHIRLIVVELPLHATALNKYTADWKYYELWMKTILGNLTAQPALQWEFWDFAGYNSISTEPLPNPAEKYSTMRYYWEGSHFRKIVGDLVLERIFLGQGSESFGFRVTPDSIDQDLTRLKEEKAREALAKP